MGKVVVDFVVVVVVVTVVAIPFFIVLSKDSWPPSEENPMSS